MLVFNNQQRSGYEEIASYSPRYYRSIKEMDAVFRLAGWLTDLMAQDMENMIAFQFLEHMDNATLSRYEGFLEIPQDMGKTLAERKAYINALQIGSGKISSAKIKAMINQFYGCECDGVTLDGSMLYISISTYAGLDVSVRNGIYNIMKQKLPAHLGMDISFYNYFGGDIYFGGMMCEADILEMKERGTGE